MKKTMRTNYNVSGIYEILNIQTNKRYIGSAVNIRLRWKTHRRRLRRGTHDSKYLQSSFNKRGLDSFKFGIIEIVDDRSDLLIREQFWMDHFKCYDREFGYNHLKIAGSNWMKEVSDVTREKLSKSHMGKKRSIEAHNKIVKSMCKQVYQLDKSSLRILNTFESCKQAEEKTGVQKQLISMCCRGITKSAKGYYWTYDMSTFKIPERYNKTPKRTRYLRELATGNSWKTIKDAGSSLGLTKNQVYSWIKWNKIEYYYEDNY